jgi:hypothetical protein
MPHVLGHGTHDTDLQTYQRATAELHNHGTQSFLWLLTPFSGSRKEEGIRDVGRHPISWLHTTISPTNKKVPLSAETAVGYPDNQLSSLGDYLPVALG